MYNIGEKHTRNTVLDIKKSDGKIKYLVACDCGDKRWVRSDILKKNKWGCKKCSQEFGRKKFGEEHSINSAWKSLTGNARNRGIEISITKQQFVNIAKMDCFYCGEHPKEKIYYDQPSWSTPAKLNGIDRVDNYVGYTIDNSVASCYICNRGKMNMSLQEFKEWILKLSKREWINE
jgi:hypothetical protein